MSLYHYLYLIIPKNQSVNIFVKFITDITDYKQDLFIYITIERYTPKIFYSIIINTGTFKKFTTGYGQYLIYKTIINNNIDINTIQTRTVNI